MTVTALSFYAHYPEFNNAERFPVGTVEYWLNFATLSLDATRWGTWLDTGLELYVAHNISLQAPALRAGASGGNPGAASGPVASKSVDKVSVSYDTGVASIEGGADFNLTTYGVRFLRLARMIGAGGVQL